MTCGHFCPLQAPLWLRKGPKYGYYNFKTYFWEFPHAFFGNFFDFLNRPSFPYLCNFYYEILSHLVIVMTNILMELIEIVMMRKLVIVSEESV